MPETTEQKEPQKEVIQHATDPRDERIKMLETKVHSLEISNRVTLIHSKWSGFAKNDESVDFLRGVEYTLDAWKPEVTKQHAIAHTEPVSTPSAGKPVRQIVDEGELTSTRDSDL